MDRLQEIEVRLSNATPQGEFCMCGGDTPDHHTIDCYLGKTVGWHWTEDGRLVNQEGDLILGIHQLGCVYVNRGDAELFQNAPTDLRYLLDFAKAAVPALKRQKRTCKVCDEKQVCGPCDAADQALAILEGGTK